MGKKSLCLLLAAVMLLSMAGCGKKAAEPTEEPTTTAATEVITEPTAEPTAKPTTESTAEPTTEPATEPTTQPTEAPLVLHSGLREDGTFDEGTLFLGDSLTYMLVGSYLEPKGLIGGAKYAANKAPR